MSKTSPLLAPPSSTQTPGLDQFIAYALHRTQLHSSVTFAALYLLQRRFKTRSPLQKSTVRSFSIPAFTRLLLFSSPLFFTLRREMSRIYPATAPHFASPYKPKHKSGVFRPAISPSPSRQVQCPIEAVVPCCTCFVSLPPPMADVPHQGHWVGPGYAIEGAIIIILLSSIL
jgi:hypothetical protein